MSQQIDLTLGEQPDRDDPILYQAALRLTCIRFNEKDPRAVPNVSLVDQLGSGAFRKEPIVPSGRQRTETDTRTSGSYALLQAFDALGTDGMHDAAEFLDALSKPGQLVV